MNLLSRIHVDGRAEDDELERSYKETVDQFLKDKRGGGNLLRSRRRWTGDC
jgi:hypothetical protein